MIYDMLNTIAKYRMQADAITFWSQPVRFSQVRNFDFWSTFLFININNYFPYPIVT